MDSESDLEPVVSAEIAQAIVSEIQRVVTYGSGESLRERKISIHNLKKAATIRA